jgi:hypothetical protein
MLKQNKSFLNQNIDSDLVHRLLKKSVEKAAQDNKINNSMQKLHALMTQHAVSSSRG